MKKRSGSNERKETAEERQARQVADEFFPKDNAVAFESSGAFAMASEWEQETRDELLRVAAAHGAIKCVKMLLAVANPKSVDLRREASDAATALMAAAGNGHAQCVALLLPLSDPDAQDIQGVTALMISIHRGASIETQKALLGASAASAKDHAGHTPLMFAAGKGRVESMEILAPFSDFSARDCDGSTALHFAAARGALPAVLWLLARSDPKAKDHAGRNAFDWAVLGLEWETADALTEHAERGAIDEAFQAAGADKMPRWAANLEKEALATVVDEASNASNMIGFNRVESPISPATGSENVAERQAERSSARRI